MEGLIEAVFGGVAKFAMFLMEGLIEAVFGGVAEFAMVLMEGLIEVVFRVAKFAISTLVVLGSSKVGVLVAIFTAVKIFGALFNDAGHTIKILSYNVWNRNDIELQKRMEALGNLIESHVPDVICFQGVTSKIYSTFNQSNWWYSYHCFVLHETMKRESSFCIQLSKLPVNSISFIPFRNSGTRVKMSMVEIEVFRGKPLVVATSHLKSPDPAHNEMFSKERVARAKMALDLLKNYPDVISHLKSPDPAHNEMFSKERVAHAKMALDHLNNYPNVIFGGDMNWDEEVDGKFPLLDGWVDAWTELRPCESGWTFDTESNPWLASRNQPLQRRLDRFICKFKDFKLKKIDIIGREAKQGLPRVVPSDHYGLLLEVQTK